MLKELMEATTNTTFFFALACTQDGKPDIGFRSNSCKDPYIDGVVWLLYADAYKSNGKRIDSVDEMLNSDVSSIIIHIGAQGIYGGQIISINLGKRKCKNIRKGNGDRYLIDIY